MFTTRGGARLVSSTVTARVGDVLDHGDRLCAGVFTDAHLISLALRHRGSVVTFDSGLRALVPPGHDANAVVEVIPLR